MLHRLSKGIGGLGAMALLAGVAGFLSFTPSAQGQAAPAAMVKRTGPAEDFIKLGFKFDGAQSCSNAQCHGAAQAKNDPKSATTLAEFTKWNGGDKHKTAFETLTNDASAKIAKGLKIADATTSERCLSCHALSVPKNLQGKQFSVEEGVTCDSCHGPSSKWLDPHSKAGWTEQQRVATKTHDAFLKTWGLYDTKSPLARADKCTSCHLAIDADMVAAGHPQPAFELNSYSKPTEKGGFYESQHWRDPNTPFYGASLWAAGQVIAVRDAALQVAARAPKGNAKATMDAYDQLAGFYSVFPGLVASGVAPKTSGVEAAMAQLATAVKGNNAAGIATAANAVAAAANKLSANMQTWKPTQANVAAAMQAVAANSNAAVQAGKGGGPWVIQQQAYAVYGLFGAYAATAKPANAPALDKQILDSLFAENITPEQFGAAMKKIQPQLPK